MKTRLGDVLSIVTLVVAAALAWTGELTGWFSPDNPPGYLWIAAGALPAYGLIWIIDRRRWVLIQRTRRALRQAKEEADHEAKRAAAEERRQQMLHTLSLPIGGDEVSPNTEELLAAQAQ